MDQNSPPNPEEHVKQFLSEEVFPIFKCQVICLAKIVKH